MKNIHSKSLLDETKTNNSLRLKFCKLFPLKLYASTLGQDTIVKRKTSNKYRASDLVLTGTYAMKAATALRLSLDRKYCTIVSKAYKRVLLCRTHDPTTVHDSFQPFGVCFSFATFHNVSCAVSGP